jgi:hypothetical protein
MKITPTSEHHKPTYERFSDLCFGDFFIHNDNELCARVFAVSTDNNAWNYSRCESMCFRSTDEIIRVPRINIDLPQGVTEVKFYCNNYKQN